MSLFRVTAIAVLALALRGDTALAQRAGARVTAKPPIKAVFEVPALPDSVAVLDVIRDYGSALMGAPPDPNKAAMLFAPDGELLPPGVAPVVGRDSIRDMLIPRSANTLRIPCKAPGLFGRPNIALVTSSPLARGMVRPSTAKRVVLCGKSSILVASVARPYRCPASILAMAALPVS